MSDTTRGFGDEGIPRSHILRGRTAVNQLFAKGKTFSHPPFRIMFYWSRNPDDLPVKVLFSVSKRIFKRAVQRNRIRRLMREVWRRHRHSLWDLANRRNQTLHVAILYSKREMPDFATVENKIIQIIDRLIASNETPD